MQGTEWIYELVDKTTAPLKNIFKELDRLDNLAQHTEKDLQQIGQVDFGFGFIADVQQAGKEVRVLQTDILNSAAGFGLYNIAATVVGEVTNAISGTAQAIIDTTGQYQKFNAVLTNSYGSAQQAAEVFKMIEDFSVKTPYNLEQVMGSFVKMRAQGFTPTYTEMTKLGDFASAMGKDFDQLAEAILDAQTGEFERMKEFGVKADANGNRIKFTFKGVTTEVDKNADSIRQYLLALGEQQGVAGSMAAIMDTWPGKLSNIDDAQQQLYKKLGELFTPAIDSWLEFKLTAVDGMMEAVEWISENSEDIQDALGALAVVVGILTGSWLLLNAEMLLGQLVAGGALAFIKALEIAQWAWNAAMSANPLGIVIGLLAAMGAIVYLLWQRSETFRSTVYGVWEAVKVLGAGVVDLAITPFKAWLEIVKSIGEVLLGVFTMDMSRIATGLNDALQAIKDANPLDKAKKIGEDMGKAYAEGRQKGIDSFAEDKKQADEQNKKSVVPGGSNPAAGSATSANNKTATGNGAGTAAAAGGKGGGGVVIQKIELGKEIKVYANTVREGAQEVRKIIHEELISALRDVEVGMSNG